MAMGHHELIDLSHTIEHGMMTYRGLPAPLICDFLSREASREHYAPGTEFQIGRISMVANTGTYLDSPFHRFADGKDLSELPLGSLAGLEGVVVRTDAPAIPRAAFVGRELRGRAVLVQTGWSRHWRTDAYFEGHPFLTEDAAVYLVAAGARLVGIDSYNVDDTSDGRRPVHTALLGAGIPIIEHMTNLVQLPAAGFVFFAVPPKVRAFGTFPVRAFAIVPAHGQHDPGPTVAGGSEPGAMEARFATPADCLLLAEMNHLLIRDEGHRNQMTVAELEQRMRAWIEAEYSAVIFEQAGEPVVYALYRETEDEVYLRQLFVARARRRQGIGRAAVVYLRSQVWPKSKRLTVEVLVTNQAALAFWRALGYRDYCLTLEILPGDV